MPHSAFTLAQVRAWQTGAPQTPGVPPPPQVSGSEHVLHWTTPPQPSLILPQALPHAAFVKGTQTAPPRPQTSGVPPPPQLSPVVQVVAQLGITAPQPSGT